MRQSSQQLTKPVGLTKVGGRYRVRKKLNGKHRHICFTKSYTAGLIAFDLYALSLEGLQENLNFPGVPQGWLKRMLERLDPVAYVRVLRLVNQD